MGVKKGYVVLENYNNNWKIQFDQEKEQLKNIFKNHAKTIEHIGSTAITGIKAKPIIDIAIGVKDLKELNEIKEDIKKQYRVKELLENDEILLIGGTEENTTIFVHVMNINEKRYQESILFRDYLNNHEKERIEYQKLKEELAIKYKDDRPTYTKSKNDFIKNILNKARNESNE